MKKLLILISFAALAVFVAACGGDDNAASKTPTAAAGSPTAVGAAPTDFPDSGRSLCTWATSRTSPTLSHWSA
jgi:PBP1b-binding outer membrane lipoprotein LpoB